MPFMLLVPPAAALAVLVAAVAPSPATLPFQNPDLQNGPSHASQAGRSTINSPLCL